MSLDITVLVNKRTVYESNYTHNVVPMAKLASLYLPLWHPEFFQHKGKLIYPVLDFGIAYMNSHAQECEKLNPPNRWGDYDTFLQFAASVCSVCKVYPNAKIYAN